MISEYRMNAEDIPRYELEILKSGICKALVPGSYYSEHDTVVIVPEDRGYNSLEERITGSGIAVLDSFRLTMSMLRSTVEACRLCEDYLIRLEDISLSVDDIFFTSELDAGLLLRGCKCEGGLTERIIFLVDEISIRFPQSNAAVIKEKITEENKRSSLDAAGILRFLSLWEIELER